MTGSRYRILAAALAVILAMALVPAGLGMSAGAGRTLVVTTAADLGSPCPSRPAPSGSLSLRCAILRANQDRSGDTISFKIPFSDRGCRTAPPSSPPAGSKRRTVCTIKPTRQIPSLRAGHTTIDGYTQPGSKPNTNPLRAGDNAILTVWLDGSAQSEENGLTIAGSHDVIRGLDVTSFGSGIMLTGSDSTVVGSFVGVDPSGRRVPNGAGISVEDGNGNTIGGPAPASADVISASNGSDVVVYDANHSTIQGSLIGTNPAGTVGLARPPFGSSRTAYFGGEGIYIDGTSKHTMIGGTEASAGNVISGNNSGVKSFNTSGTSIEGNLIGTNASGTGRVPNIVGLDLMSGDASIGGTKRGAGNLISGNRLEGIFVYDGRATIQGNRIGIGATGRPLGNGVGDVPPATVPVTAGARDGIVLTGIVGSTTWNSNLSMIADLTGNIIAFSGGSGVGIGENKRENTHVALSRNSIFANHGLGIDLFPRSRVACKRPSRGVLTINTPCPSIREAKTTQVRGTACARCTVEVYIATNETEDHGHGEGKTYLGSATVNTNGAWALNAPFAARVVAGQRVTATATTPASPGPRETSEFAANVAVTTAKVQLGGSS